MIRNKSNENTGSTTRNPHGKAMLYLGGQHNDEFRIAITLTVDMRNSEELKLLNLLISRINSLYFRQNEFHPSEYNHRQFSSKCDYLMDNISVLLASNSGSTSHTLIHKAVNVFLRGMLDRLKEPALHPGDLRYAAYTQRVQILSDATLCVNNALHKHGFSAQTVPNKKREYKMLRTSDGAHLHHPDIVQAAPPRSKHVTWENTEMSRLRNQLNRLLREEPFASEFKTFQQILGRVLLAQDNIHEKINIVDHLISQIEQETSASERSLLMMAFLKRCQERIQRPLSTEITGNIETLKIKYGAVNATPHDQYKLKFLQQFQSYIVSNPQLSYKDCLRAVSAKLHPSREDIYFSHKSSLFVQHRFNDLIGNIVNDKNDAPLNMSDSNPSGSVAKIISDEGLVCA